MCIRPLESGEAQGRGGPIGYRALAVAVIWRAVKDARSSNEYAAEARAWLRGARAARLLDALKIDRRRVSKWLQEIEDGMHKPSSTKDDLVDSLVGRLRPWWAEHGGHYGAKSAAVRFLFGNNTPANGRWWYLTVEAIERIESRSVSGQTD